jgi:hypothetical protein
MHIVNTTTAGLPATLLDRLKAVLEHLDGENNHPYRKSSYGCVSEKDLITPERFA